MMSHFNKCVQRKISPMVFHTSQILIGGRYLNISSIKQILKVVNTSHHRGFLLMSIEFSSGTFQRVTKPHIW